MMLNIKRLECTVVPNTIETIKKIFSKFTAGGKCFDIIYKVIRGGRQHAENYLNEKPNEIKYGLNSKTNYNKK
jgi:hypothetical protein